MKKRIHKRNELLRRGFRKIIPSLLLIFSLLIPLMSPIGATLITDKTNMTYVGSNISYAASKPELRGAWVATVYNLDYPNVATTNSSVLKTQLDSIVKNAGDMGLNAIFFQVRPSADAFYDSDYFPWSRFLTGKQGTAPSDGFDPLKYLIEIAHKRNIQVHAWINPYRVTTKGDEELQQLTATHPAKINPDYLVKYNDNYYFDPAIPEVRDLLINSTVEIVQKYDVDGIHMDDYFYPGHDFDDSASFAKYGAGYTNIEDWRRHNVDILVERLDTVLHQKDADISFGISPVGIWANKSTMPEGSNTNGNESYTSLYADTKKWVEKGWVDYIAPQIYWNIGHSTADYKELLDWWTKTVGNTGVKLYIGMAAYKCCDADSASPWHGTQEITDQLKLNDTKDNVSGEIMYRYKSLLDIPGLSNAVKSYYGGDASGNAPGGSTDSNGTAKPNDSQGSTVKFTDLNEAKWAEDYIYRLAGKGIVTGKGNGIFAPMENVTRAQYITMLVNTFGFDPDDSYNCTYGDVEKGQWYYPYLASAQHYGILPSGEGSDTNGLTSSGNFSPDEAISREDMALFAHNALKALSLSTSGTKAVEFTDKASISNQGKQTAIYDLASLGILSGYSEDHSFRPMGLATRAESSTIICALLDYFESN